VVAIAAALSAGSVALAGFGLDSLIEIGASTIVIWQLKDTAATRERPALRLIGIAFIALAIYIATQATYTLISTNHPEPSTLGITWTAVTCAVMLALTAGKARTGQAPHNRVLQTEAASPSSTPTSPPPSWSASSPTPHFNGGGPTPLAGLVIVYYGLHEGRQALRASRQPHRGRHSSDTQRPIPVT
jgi:hypothetical protein